MRTAIPENNNTNYPRQRRSIEDDQFVLHHVGITRQSFIKRRKLGINAENSKILNNPRLMISKIYAPTTQDFMYYLKRVGQEYGWERREMFQPQKMKTLRKTMVDRNYEIISFLIDGQEAGFCCIATLDKYCSDAKNNNQLTKTEAIRLFSEKNKMNFDQSEFVEIYKIGLFAEYTQNGYGHYFLNKVVSYLFDNKKYDAIYLDTRDTNHTGIFKFYERNGFSFFYQETLPSDLVPKSSNLLKVSF